MKKIISVLVIVMLMGSLCACSGKNNPMNHLTECEVLVATKPNAAEVDKWYVCNATISDIYDDGCNIKVYYPEDNQEVDYTVSFSSKNTTEVSVKDKVVLIGLLEKKDNQYALLNAKILDVETVKNNFVLAKVREQIGTVSDTRYFKHQYDKNIGQIVAYEASGSEKGSYTLTYDSNGNVTELSRKGPYGTATEFYTYDAENLLSSKEEHYDYDTIRNGNKFEYTYEKSSDGKITKETVVNITDPEKYTTVHTFDEYDGDRLIKKTEYGQKKNYDIRLEYDVYGNVIKESSSISRYYEFGVVANKHK